jgi:ribosome-binding factor A
LSSKKSILLEKILNASNTFIRSEVSDTRLTFVSFSRVELSDDNSHAKLYWDTFDASKRGDAKKAMDGLGGKLRSYLSKFLKMRHTPTVTFVYDSQFEDEKAITDLLKDESDKGKGVS